MVAFQSYRVYIVQGCFKSYIFTKENKFEVLQLQYLSLRLESLA